MSDTETKAPVMNAAGTPAKTTPAATPEPAPVATPVAATPEPAPAPISQPTANAPTTVAPAPAPESTEPADVPAKVQDLKAKGGEKPFSVEEKVPSSWYINAGEREGDISATNKDTGRIFIGKMTEFNAGLRG
jgi:hypothetical protein